MKKAFFLTKTLFGTIYCHSFLLLCWLIAERSPKHPALLFPCWGLLWTPGNQEMKDVFVWEAIYFFFHENIKCIWWLTKNQSRWAQRSIVSNNAPHDFYSISLNSNLFPNSIFRSNIIVSHNIVGNIFPLWLLFVFRPFLSVRVFGVEARKSRGVDNSYSEKTRTAVWASSKANYSVLRPLPAFPSPKQKVMKM